MTELKISCTYKKRNGRVVKSIIHWVHDGQDIEIILPYHAICFFCSRKHKVIIEIYSIKKFFIYTLFGQLCGELDLFENDDSNYHGLAKSSKSRTGIVALYCPVNKDNPNWWVDLEEHEFLFKNTLGKKIGIHSNYRTQDIPARRVTHPQGRKKALRVRLRSDSSERIKADFSRPTNQVKNFIFYENEMATELEIHCHYKHQNDTIESVVSWLYKGKKVEITLPHHVVCLFSAIERKIIIEVYAAKQFLVYNLVGDLENQFRLSENKHYNYYGLEESKKSSTGIVVLYCPVAHGDLGEWGDIEEYEFLFKPHTTGKKVGLHKACRVKSMMARHLTHV